MNKQQLEDKLSAAFENGFVPTGIVKPVDSGPLRVIQKDGEDERITVMYRQIEHVAAHMTQAADMIAAQDRAHNSQFIYTLEEVEAMLAFYEKGIK